MSNEAKSVKIWYQSFVDQTQQASYFRDLGQALQRTVDPGVRFDPHGIVPPDVVLHRLTEFRCAREVVRNALAAQQQGYDAMAIGHFQDAGLYEARAAVELPVLGLGESSMLYASMLGRKIALVTINPIFIPMHEEQINRYGLRDRVVAVKAITTDPAMLVRAFTDSAMYDRVIQQFREQAQPLVDIGIEVIIPAGGFTCSLVFSIAELHRRPGGRIELHRRPRHHDRNRSETAPAERHAGKSCLDVYAPVDKALREFLDHEYARKGRARRFGFRFGRVLQRYQGRRSSSGSQHADLGATHINALVRPGSSWAEPAQNPSSSDSRTSDSSSISSRQLKQGKGNRSMGIAQTSPTDESSIAGPPHSLWIKTSMSPSS